MNLKIRTSFNRKYPILATPDQYNKKYINGPKKRLTAQEYFWKKWVLTNFFLVHFGIPSWDNRYYLLCSKNIALEI